MNNTTINKNIENFKSEGLDWGLIQTQMKNKLGQEIYESWLKKINFVDEFNNYILLTVPSQRRRLGLSQKGGGVSATQTRATVSRLPGGRRCLQRLR